MNRDLGRVLARIARGPIRCASARASEKGKIRSGWPSSRHEFQCARARIQRVLVSSSPRVARFRSYRENSFSFNSSARSTMIVRREKRLEQRGVISIDLETDSTNRSDTSGKTPRLTSALTISFFDDRD